VHLTSIKPWPSCRHTHPAIDASLELSSMLDTIDIARVEVDTYAAALDVCDRPVAGSEYEAKFSLQHCVATALQRGKVDFSAFGDKARADAAPLAKKIAVNAADPYASAYPGSWGARVSVTLADGTALTASKKECKGDPEAALDDDEMIAKARELLKFGGVNDATSVIEGVMGMASGMPPPDLGAFLTNPA